jgi:hypothetical protein
VGEFRNAYENSAYKPEGKEQYRNSSCGWEDNIKMNVKETGCEGVNWIRLPENRTQLWTRKHDNEPWVSLKGRKLLEQLSDYLLHAVS